MASLQDNLDNLLSFLEDSSGCVPPYDGVVDVLQMFRSLTCFQYSVDQSMADGGTLLPPLGQSIPSILHTLTGESKLVLAVCCQRNREKSLAMSMAACHFTALDSSLY